MTKLNSLSLAVALSLSVIPLKSEAIGLGKYDSNAQLNQPLNLSIPVLTEHDDLSGFKAYLADYNQHERFGIIFPGWMPKIKANVLKQDDGYQLMLTTNRPIKEPIVNFVLAVDYQGMKLYKEITLFLDPPTKAQIENRIQIKSNLAAQPIVGAETTFKTSSQSLPIRSKLGNDTQLDDSNRVKRGDSLWTLAAQWELKGVNQNEKMELLYQNNGHAFINGNRGLIKEGSLINYSSDLIANSQQSRLESNTYGTVAAQTDNLNNIEPSAENQTSASGKTAFEETKIAQMQQKIGLLNQTISRQQEQNQQLKVQLAKIEDLIANMQQKSTSGAAVPIVELAKSTSALEQTRVDAKPLGPAIYPSPTEQAKPSAFANISPNLFLLYWSIGLLAIGLVTQKLFNQWKFNRFNRRLANQLSKLNTSTAAATSPIPSIDELRLPKESSVANRIKYIQSAANFYLRCHRFDLAKELVNESLIQYASNSRIVKELLELRRTIYQTIDKGLKTDIVEKLDSHGADNPVSGDNIEPFDQFGQRWNRKVS